MARCRRSFCAAHDAVAAGACACHTDYLAVAACRCAHARIHELMAAGAGERCRYHVALVKTRTARARCAAAVDAPRTACNAIGFALGAIRAAARTSDRRPMAHT